MTDSVRDNRYFTEYILIEPKEWNEYNKLKQEKENEEKKETQQQQGGVADTARGIVASAKHAKIYHYAETLIKIQKILTGVREGKITEDELRGNTIPSLIKTKKDILKNYGDAILNLPIPPAQMALIKHMTEKKENDPPVEQIPLENTAVSVYQPPESEKQQQQTKQADVGWPEIPDERKRKRLEHELAPWKKTKIDEDDETNDRNDLWLRESRKIQNKDLLNYLMWLLSKRETEPEEQKGGNSKENNKRSMKITSTLPEDTPLELYRPLLAGFE